MPAIIVKTEIMVTVRCWDCIEQHVFGQEFARQWVTKHNAEKHADEQPADRAGLD